MPFLHPLLALGALGGLIPIIIHLLNRRRFRITRWAAMEFLLASLKKNYKRVRFENLLLLLLRVLLLVLIALALARFSAERELLGSLGAESRHAVLILDHSYSMRLRDGSDTSFDRAKRHAEQILGTLNKGDVVSLLLMSDIARPLVKEATLDVGLVRREVKRLEPGWGGTDVGRALVAADDLLADSTKPRKEVFLITDMQAAGWGRGGTEPADELKEALARLKKTAKTFVVDVGTDDGQNLAITKLEPVSRIIGAGARAEFEVEVTNFGETKQSSVRVDCLVDRFKQETKEIDIPPGGTEAVAFAHTFVGEGSHLVQAQLARDRLAADNTRHLAIQVEKAVRVLLVNGETGTKPEDNETYYLQRALMPPPATSGEAPVSYIEPTTITEFETAATDFGRYRLVVLANLASLAAGNAVTRLEDYVREGGALVVFLGDRIDAAFYNDQLFKQGRGLLPARIGEEAGGDGARLELVKPVHRMFELFTDERAYMVTERVLFRRHLDLTLPESREDIREVARFDTGGPAIVEKTFGRGRVLLLASSCDAEWTSFPTAAAYAVVMHEMVDHLVSGDLARRNVLVHQPYRRTFSPDELIESVTVRPPGGAGVEKTLRPYPIRGGAAAASEAAAVTEIVFADTDVAGLHEIELKRRDGDAMPPEYFSVNVPPDEADLRRIDEQGATARLKGFDFRYARSVSDLRLAVRRSRTGREFTRELLLLVLALMCVELILGQWFGR